MTILAIDTSGKTAGVALMNDGRIVGETSIVTRLTHSQVILPMVERLLKDCETDIDDIDTVAAANGPGSYTGLRIGIGAVKGMCAGSQKLRCAGVSTLLALAYNASAFNGYIYTVLKARGTICYFASFKAEGGRTERLSPDCLSESSDIAALIKENGGRAMLIGDCAEDIKALFKDDENVITAPENISLPRASGICMAVMNDPTLITEAEGLTVSYLQPTRAQKSSRTG